MAAGGGQPGLDLRADAGGGVLIVRARTIAWVDRLAWILLYAGLLAVVLGLATLSSHEPAGWTLIVAGAVLAAAGAVLVWVRSRLEPGG